MAHGAVRALAYLETLGRLLSLRNSGPGGADYDNRAFDSWIPLQRSWQRRFGSRPKSRLAVPASRDLEDGWCGLFHRGCPGCGHRDVQTRAARALRRHLVQGR